MTTISDTPLTATRAPMTTSPASSPITPVGDVCHTLLMQGGMDTQAVRLLVELQLAGKDGTAYLQLADNGKALVTIITTQRLGKYLTTLADTLDPPVPEWAVKSTTEAITALLRVNADDVKRLECLRDADGIREAYRTPLSMGNGNKSCMTNSYSVRAYASLLSPELALAVLRDERGAIIARTLADTDRRYYLRIYGDVARMQAVLAAVGYTRSEHMMLGMQLVAVCPDTGQTMAPFLDGDHNLATLRDGYWAITKDPREATHVLCRTDGRADEHEPTRLCPCCDEYTGTTNFASAAYTVQGELVRGEACIQCRLSADVVYDTVSGAEVLYIRRHISDESPLEVIGHKYDAWLPTDYNREQLLWHEERGVWMPKDAPICVLDGEAIPANEAVLISPFAPSPTAIAPTPSPSPVYAHHSNVTLWIASCEGYDAARLALADWYHDHKDVTVAAALEAGLTLPAHISVRYP